MIDEREVFEKSFRRYEPEGGSFERLVRRRDRKRRNQRIAAGVVGIAVFVGALWIVTSGLSLDRSEKSVAPGGEVTGPAQTGPTQTAPPSAPASGAPATVVRAGTCSDSATWRLEGTDTGDWIKVRFEVHQSPVGHSWRIVLRRFYGYSYRVIVQTVVVFRGTRVAAEDGEVVVQQRVWDAMKRDDWVRAKAVDRQTGQFCNVETEIW